MEPEANVALSAEKKKTTSRKLSNRVVETSEDAANKVIENSEEKSKKDSYTQQHSILKMQLPPLRKISTQPPIPHIMIHDPAVAA